jgi:hypothetical protein
MDETQRVTAIDANPVDAVQVTIKNIMEVEKGVTRPTTNATAEVEAQRRQEMHRLFDGAEQVDLVGHSTPINRYLTLGGWVLNREEATRLASYMPPSVKTVRLIGCATASTVEGIAAVEAIAQNGLSAAGTLRKVYTTHFDKQGVKPPGKGEPGLRRFSPGVRPERPSLPPAPAPPAATSSPSASSPPVSRTYAPGLSAGYHARLTVPRPIAWLGRCAWSVIAVPFAALWWLLRRPFVTHAVPHQWILWLLSARSTAMPGLLTEPLLTFEITSGRKTWTLEILFDFEYARFYSDAAKRHHVYKIRGFGRVAKTLLEAYLELPWHGVTEKTRHPEAALRKP